MKQVITKIALIVAYLLFVAYSSYMTAESIKMSFNANNVWYVFPFVFIVAIIAGFFLKDLVIKEIQNTINPSKSKLVLGLLGFLLFWGASFTTNVHYMLMQNEGLQVVSAELGNYKNFVDNQTNNTKNDIKEQEEDDMSILESTIQGFIGRFQRECEHSMRDGFGPVAKGILKEIESYFTTSSAKYNDTYEYKNTIFDDEKDSGDIGKRGATVVAGLENKYINRIVEKAVYRQSIIKSYYKRKIQSKKSYALIQEFINDSVYGVDIPQLKEKELATAENYYKFQKDQLRTNIYDRFDSEEKAKIDLTTKESKTKDIKDIELGKFRYKVYPSERMFSTFNVWSDMLQGRLPVNMKLFGWIIFSLIIDIVAFVLRSFI
ncbi:MAG: hypothetical protein IJ180_08180 [Bacteroidales bacterium]|nr:hypothetical protein [Bacteroidales bacterium]